MSTFSEQDFYGSAIHGVIPASWIDASTLRQIPDHQETYLSPKTLSNLIIEINQRVPATEALSIHHHHHQQNREEKEEERAQFNFSQGGIPNTTETIDKAAALYHLHDLCDEGDSVDVIVPSRRVTLGKLGGDGHNGVPAYTGVVTFTTPITKQQQQQQQPGRESNMSGATGATGIDAGVGGGGGGIPGSINGTARASDQGGGGPRTSKSTCHYLLVRLEAQETDLVVFFNVPHNEFDMTGDPRGLSKEEELGSEFIEKLVEVLEVRDWGLFV